MHDRKRDNEVTDVAETETAELYYGGARQTQMRIRALVRGSNCFGGAKSSVSQTSILNWCHFSETVLTDCHIFKSVNSSVLLSKLALFPTTRYLFSVHKHNSGPKLWIVQCDKIPLCCGQNSFYFCAKN